MIYEGILKCTLTGSRSYVDSQYSYLKIRGWKLIEYRRKIQWPYFWKWYFYAVMTKDIIVKKKHIIETSLNDLL